MATTWFEQGLEKGRQEAATRFEQEIEHGRRALVASVLQRRFGRLSPELQARIDQWPGDRLDELIDRAYRVDSPDDLLHSTNGASE